MGVSLLLLALLGVLVGEGEGFPDGAPIEACILPEPNRPNHQGTKPREPQSSKHIFVASGSQYRPGTTIGVFIGGPSFKGFFVQARDVHTNKWVGNFVETKQTTSFPECSAVTHATVPPKSDVYLTWHAPPHASGAVYFTGTILERYDKYWSDMVAKEDDGRVFGRGPGQSLGFFPGLGRRAAVPKRG